MQRIVNKYLKRQYKHLSRFKQFEKPEAKADETNRGKESAPQPFPTSKRIVGLPDKEAYRAKKIELIDEMLELIDSEVMWTPFFGQQTGLFSGMSQRQTRPLIGLVVCRR